MQLRCPHCEAVRIVHPKVEERIDLLCDECTAEDWLLANGKTKLGKTSYHKGFKVGVGAQWDPDFEKKNVVGTARRNGRKPVTKASIEKKRAENADQSFQQNRANTAS